MNTYNLPVLYEIQARKSARELAFIKKALTITEGAMARVRNLLVPGISEIEIANYIVDFFDRQRVKALAFPPIVAFGKNSAEIHHTPTYKKLQRGDFAMIDMGATWEGYCADMTRTFIVGTPTEKQKKMYITVLRALQTAEKILQRGERKARKIDTVARKIIEKQFGKKSFPHAVGHGVGRPIHEWPHIGPRSDDHLLPSSVCTVEPGVYISGIGGVRIEDMALIINGSAKILTKFPRELADITIQTA